MPRQLRRLLNLSEEAVFARLQKTCEEYGASVYTKVRLADVFRIENSGISENEYRFALQSHFDFVVTDADHRPLFAVEFDGPTHGFPRQRRRDAMKDSLCERFMLPLLRTNSKYLTYKYGSMDVLTWLVEMWFLQEGFHAGQLRGDIPPDDVFFASFIFQLEGDQMIFPYWLSAPVQASIRRLYDAGKCKDYGPSNAVGYDEQRNYHALSWIRITDSSGALAKTAMRKQNFPLVGIIDELLYYLAMFDLYEELTHILRGQSSPLPLDDVKTKLLTFARDYTVISSGTTGGLVDAEDLLAVKR